MSYCKRLKGVLLSLDFRMGFITLVRVSCKMWNCPCCRVKNARNWRAYLLDTFNKKFGHEAWCFVTITAHKNAHKHSSEMTIKNLQQGWKRLYDRLRRHYKKRLEYVRIFERHASGRFHMHILLNVGLEYDKSGFVIKGKLDEFRHPECRYLSRACASVGIGWRVHIRRVWDDVKRSSNVGLVVGYILKYMGKDMASFAFPKHQRRIQTSRKIGSPATNAKGVGTWEHKREIGITYLREAKKRIVDMTTGEVLAIRSFEGEAYYPPLEYYRGETDVT
jgi:Replication protein